MMRSYPLECQGAMLRFSMYAGQDGHQSMQFSDKDEHVYFWFPLLAGLSELTFDPRPDIRRAALEVCQEFLSSS